MSRLVVVSILLLGCGGKVVVDDGSQAESASATSGAGGAASGAGAASVAASSATTSSTGVATGASCEGQGCGAFCELCGPDADCVAGHCTGNGYCALDDGSVIGDCIPAAEVVPGGPCGTEG